MKMTLAERIQARIDALNKNPSSVSLEAGLSRSAVRDIISGKVRHSRIDTLKSLTGPLECTLEYLTGETEEPAGQRSSGDYWEYDTEGVGEIRVLEAGVFRAVPKADFDFSERPPHQSTVAKKHLKYKDYRLPEQGVNLFQMGDDSMSALHIVKGDVLTAVDMGEHQIPFAPGLILVVRQHLSSRKVEEWSVRQVTFAGGDLHLVCRSSDDIPPIVISASDLDNESALLMNFYLTHPDGDVTIEGVVSRVTREVALPSILTEISHNQIDV